MKRFTICFLMFLLVTLVVLPLKAQQQRVSLKSVLQKLKQEQGIQISYESRAIKNVKISFDDKSADLTKALRQGLPPNLVLEEVAGRLILKPLAEGVQPFYLSITECESGTSLPFATVSLVDQNRGKVADENGRVTFYHDVASDQQVNVSFLGYQDAEYSLNAMQPNGINAICLNATPSVLNEVIVEGANFNTFQVYSETGRIALGTNNLNSFPVLGEPDVFRNIQMLPGIQASGENTSQITVRSNDSYQNLVLFDGFSLFHLDHFLGVFSTFNPHVVKGVEVYKGVFPGEYGGRTASVINVLGKGDSDGDEVIFSANQMAANLMAHASIGKQGDFLIAFRRSLTDIIQSGIHKTVFDKTINTGIEKLNPGDPFSNVGDPIFKFYDLHAKLSYDLTPKTKIGVSLFRSEDELDLITNEFIEDSFDFTSTDLVSWSNTGFQTKLNHEIDLNRRLEVQVGYAAFESQADFQDEFLDEFDPFESTLDSGYTDNEIDEKSFKLNYYWGLDRNLSSKSGLFYAYMSTDFNSVSNDEFIDFASSAFADFGIYSDWNFQNGPLNLNAGGRIHHYTGNGSTYFEPTVNASYFLSDALHLKAGFRLSNQYLHQVNNELSYSVTPNSWLLAGGDADLPIQRSVNFQAGLGWQKEQWSIDFETFYYETSGVLTYISGLNNLNADENFFDQWQFSGDRRGLGAELLAQYTKGAFESWLSYTLSKSENRFDEVKAGNWFASTLDQRHEITGTLLYQLNAWKFGLTGVLASGKPYTDLEASFDEIDVDEIGPVSNINESRLPEYRRVDLTIGHTLDFGETEMEFGLSIFNLFGRENVKSRIYRQYFYDEEGNELDIPTFIPAELRLLGFTPNIFLKFHYKK